MHVDYFVSLSSDFLNSSRLCGGCFVISWTYFRFIPGSWRLVVVVSVLSVGSHCWPEVLGIVLGGADLHRIVVPLLTRLVVRLRKHTSYSQLTFVIARKTVISSQSTTFENRRQITKSKLK